MKKIITILSAITILFSLFTVTSFAAETEIPFDSSWVITESSAYGTAKATRCFDDDASTYWHTNYTVEDGKVASHDEPPHTITVDFGKTLEVSGFIYTPRTDNASGTFTKYNIYASEDGETFKKIFEGTFDYIPGPATDFKPSKASWGNVSMKAIKIEGVTTLSGYGTCAEIDFLTGGSGTKIENGEVYKGNASEKPAETPEAETSDGKVNLDKSKWTIKASTEISWGIADKAIDGDTKTYWHTVYTAEGSTITSKAELPHILEITLPALESIDGMKYLPRQEEQSGRWLEIEIYASETGTDKGDLVKKANFDQTNQALQTVEFGKTIKAKKITVVVTKSAGGHGTCAEIDFYKNGTETSASYSSSTSTVKTLDKSGWSIKANSEISWGMAEKAIDGDEKNTWHTNYKSEGSTIVSKDEAPHTLEITFSKAEEITGMKYLPRQDGQTGRWLEAEIYASESGEDKGTLIKKETFVQTDSEWKTINFGKTVKAKKVTIVITKSAASFGTCSEIDFICGEIADGTAAEKNPYPDKFDMSDWEFEASSEKDWGPIEKAFDGDKDTFWHTDYVSEGSTILSHDMPPYNVDIIIPEPIIITGFSITPRPGNSSGKIKSYRLYASKEDEGELTLLMEGELMGQIATESIDFECGVEVKRIRLEVLDGQSGYGTLAEMVFFPATPETVVVPYEELEKTMNENKMHRIEPTSIKMSNDLPTWANSKIAAVSDGSLGSMWQTDEIKNDEAVLIGVDLGEVKTISSISITPRQSSDYHGYWTKFNIWASEDGNNYVPVVENFSFPKKSLDEKFIDLEESITARYFEFEILEYFHHRVSCAEIAFWQSYEDKTASGDGGKYTLKIGSNEIKVENGSDSHVKTIDVAPYITSVGSTLIPLRGLVEEMGCEITWDGDTQTITLVKGLMKIELQIQNKLVYVDDPVYGYTMYTLTSAPRIKDSRTFIPVRFVSEMLGYEVSWDGATQTITITK